METTRRSLVFRVDPKLLQHRPPRLTLAATLVTLAKRVELGELDANLIVEILDENRLLPYIIGDTKNLHVVALGQSTNASKIGDLIVSEECIRGSYDLCISFLGFVLTVLRMPDYVDSSKTMLASVTYIANEIYPNHSIWTYRHITDMSKILCRCTEIFYQVIHNEQRSSLHSNLNAVCHINLSQNQAHRQLLDVIVEGKQQIKKVISEPEFNGEDTLEETPIVRCTRRSIMIFNQLLSGNYEIKNSELRIRGQRRKAESSSDPTSSPMSNIERAVFDTSMRPGLLQHLFSYIYQKEDSVTACLAIDLIKKIAEKFSMSLMACLGSEADRVCQYFIKCLGEEQANVKLQIAIVNLLSTCIRHQPGLIELFLNFKTDAPSDLSSVQVILNLSKRCQNQHSDDHRTLYIHVLQFILTFWRKCHSAIDQFDKAENFWNLVTNPLIKFLETWAHQQVNDNTLGSPVLIDRLNSNSLMILAREIFNVNSGINDRKMNVKLQERLNELASKNFLEKYSGYIKKRYSNLEKDFSKSDDYNLLSAAWRDFLASYSKFKPFDIDQTIKQQIIVDTFSCLIIELRLGEQLDKERTVSIGETLLLICSKWMNANGDDEVFKSIHELLYLADTYKEFLPFSFLLAFQSTVNLYLMRNRDFLINSKKSFDLFVPSLQLMHFSLKIMESYINSQSKQIEFDYKPNIESRLCQTSMMTLRFIVDISRPHVNLWLSYMQTNMKTDAMIQFLAVLVNRRAGPEVCLSMIELLLCLSSIDRAADFLNKSLLIHQVNMIAVSLYERPYAHLSQLATMATLTKTGDLKGPNGPNTKKGPMSDTERTYIENINSSQDWLPIYRHIIRLNISTILTLGNAYISTAIDFLSTHCIRICEIIELLRTKPRSVNIEEALLVVYMINLVLHHGKMWIRRNNQSYTAISDEIAKTAYSLATSALPPPVTNADSQATARHTSLRPRDCLIYARCCYDFGKYTEAERVLFQTKFGDKNGFISEAAQIYGEDLSVYAFHLASLICLKTNRQSDSIDFALQVFAGDPEHFDILTAFTQNKL